MPRGHPSSTAPSPSMPLGAPDPRHDESATSDLTLHDFNGADADDHIGARHPTLATVTGAIMGETAQDDAPRTTETTQQCFTRLPAIPPRQDRLKLTRRHVQPGETTTPYSIDCDLSGEDFSTKSKELRVARLRILDTKVATVTTTAFSLHTPSSTVGETQSSPSERPRSCRTRRIATCFVAPCQIGRMPSILQTAASHDDFRLEQGDADSAFLNGRYLCAGRVVLFCVPQGGLPAALEHGRPALPEGTIVNPKKGV